AAINRAISVVDPDYPSAGGSTLATQIEKYRHSPEGRTASSPEKLRQMVSASVRAYLDGEETLHTRQRIIADYINSVPLGAFPGYGEVNGIADGLATWYGADFDAVNRLLRRPQADGAALAPQARAYREVLSLMIARRRRKPPAWSAPICSRAATRPSCSTASRSTRPPRTATACACRPTTSTSRSTSMPARSSSSARRPSCARSSATSRSSPSCTSAM